MSFVVVISIIHAFQAFDLVYVLTGRNGGPETATYVLGIMLFQHAFAFLEFGYASALAWVMFAILLVLTVLQLRLTRRRSSWEDAIVGLTERMIRRQHPACRRAVRGADRHRVVCAVPDPVGAVGLLEEGRRGHASRRCSRRIRSGPTTPKCSP